MRALLVPVLLASLAGCPEERSEKTKEIAASTFRTMLQCAVAPARDEPRCEYEREQAILIERVRVEPTGKGSARYVVYMKNTATKNVVFAEYPGKITDEMTAAGILYDVKPR